MRLNNTGKARRQLIYILSPSFSGSTLLTLLLAQHPRIATIGELKATSMGPIKDYACSCGEVITECRFWRELESRLYQKGTAFSLDHFGTHFQSEHQSWNKVLNAQVRSPAFETLRNLSIALLPGLKTHFETILETNRQFIETSCSLQNADFFLDGSKDPHRLLYLQQSGFWDIHVIRMYRDGRAQSHSHRKKFEATASYEEAAREWFKTINHMDHVCREFDTDRIMTVKYEDLCANPTATMERCWNHLDIETVNMDWTNVDLKQSPHHILGNQMRTRDSIQISLDEKWKTQVSESELTTFEHIAGDLNRQLGYS